MSKPQSKPLLCSVKIASVAFCLASNIDLKLRRKKSHGSDFCRKERGARRGEEGGAPDEMNVDGGWSRESIVYCANSDGYTSAGAGYERKKMKQNT